jgi:hypothetical protein
MLHAGAYQWKKEKFSQFFNFISCSIDDVVILVKNAKFIFYMWIGSIRLVSSVISVIVLKL